MGGDGVFAATSMASMVPLAKEIERVADIRTGMTNCELRFEFMPLPPTKLPLRDLKPGADIPEACEGDSGGEVDIGKATPCPCGSELRTDSDLDSSPSLWIDSRRERDSSLLSASVSAPRPDGLALPLLCIGNRPCGISVIVTS